MRQCCSASSSVGAISAAWPPLPTARAAAAAATTVLPQPTSPCTSRTMGSCALQVVLHLVEHALLRAGEREGQRCDEAARQVLRVAQGRRRLALDALLQLLQRELVRQQFLEGQATLRGMAPGGQRWPATCPPAGDA